MSNKEEFSLVHDDVANTSRSMTRRAGIVAGHIRATNRLEQLRFDPIQELVDKYRKLEEELTRHEEIRDGKRVELLGNGKARAYHADTHYSVYDKLITVANALLRYNYGRVPEINTLETRQPQPLVVNLTPKGGTYIVNEADDGD